jgi:hypothetical protein
MTKPQKPEMEWHSPKALADRANEGFLLVVRSTGKTIGGLLSGIVKGISKVGQVLMGREQRMVKRQTEPLEAAPPPQLDEEMEQARPQYPPLDVEALLEEHSPQDTVKAVMSRKALNDLLHGPEEASAGALKTLVGLGHVAEPFLVACLQTDSPQVAEIALEGLSRIGSQRLPGCLSNMLGSSDTELRIVALRAAGRLPDHQEQQPFLARGLRDPSARVRRRALSYISRHDSYWAIAEAMRLCDDPEPYVQWAAVEALMALGPSEAHSTLRLMMPSLDPAYQRRAAILLEQRKDQGALSGKTEEGESKATKRRRKESTANTSSVRSKPRSAGSRKSKGKPFTEG